MRLRILLLLLVAGCSSPPASSCLPGQHLACAGPGGCPGTQVCLESGLAVGPCECGPLTDAGAAGRPDGSTPGTDGGVFGSDGGLTGDDGGLFGTDGGVFGADAGPLPPGVYEFPARDFRCAPSASPPCALTQPVLSPAARRVVLPRDRTPAPLVYVMHVLGLTSTADVPVAGLDIDGLDSGEDGASGGSFTCEERMPDYPAGSHDPAHLGIDNAMAALIPVAESFLAEMDCGGDTRGCLTRILQAQVDAGDVILLVELTGVDSLSYDDAVGVTLYAATIAAPAHEPSGRLSPGQTFHTESVSAAMTTGDIFQGRLRAEWPMIALPAGASPSMLATTDLYRAELRANISETSLSAGLIAGTQRTADILAQAEMIAPDQVALVASFLDATADVAPSGDPSVCTELSNAMTFSGIRALRTP